MTKKKKQHSIKSNSKTAKKRTKNKNNQKEKRKKDGNNVPTHIISHSPSLRPPCSLLRKPMLTTTTGRENTRLTRKLFLVSLIAARICQFTFKTTTLVCFTEVNNTIRYDINSLFRVNITRVPTRVCLANTTVPLKIADRI